MDLAHAALGDAEHVADLRERESFVVIERQHEALTVGHAVDRVGEHLTHLLGLERLDGIVTTAGDRVANGGAASSFGARAEELVERDHADEADLPEHGCELVLGHPQLFRDLAVVGTAPELVLELGVRPLDRTGLGAHRAGITTIILPKDNEADLEDIPEEVRNQLSFHCVSTLEEVFAIAIRRGLPEMLRFVDRIAQLDETFREFVEFCHRNGLRLEIVSEGLDLYIDPLLRKWNLDLPVRTNHVILDGGRVRIEHPWADATCRLCRTCKLLRLFQLRTEGYRIAYVGDGPSDLCPAIEADIVFAKAELATLCEEESIAYSAFERFADVQQLLRGVP